MPEETESTTTPANSVALTHKMTDQLVGDLDTENNLINHRLTWLLLGQPVLLLAYGNLLTAKLAPGETFVADQARRDAINWIPWLGFWSAAAILVGVLAAEIAFVLIVFRPPRKTFGVNPLTSIFGFIPPLAIPALLMITWGVLDRPVPSHSNDNDSRQLQNARYMVVEILTPSAKTSAVLDTATGKISAAAIPELTATTAKPIAEPTHALEPAAASDSNGESSPPAQ